jgi:hypothetical protein
MLVFSKMHVQCTNTNAKFPTLARAASLVAALQKDGVVALRPSRKLQEKQRVRKIADSRTTNGPPYYIMTENEIGFRSEAEACST